MSDCAYVTAGWGIHDERWLGALREVGRDPIVVSLGPDAVDVAELRARIARAAEGTSGLLPVLAGPDLASGRLVAPFKLSLPLTFAYYIVSGLDTAEREDVVAFRDWLIAEAARET